MGIQTITGIVKDTNGDPWANRVVEAAFSDGYVPLSPLNAFARTDTNGKFQLKVDNNTDEVKAAVLRLPDDSLFGFDLDPEDTTLDLGDCIASGVEGAARLLPVPDGIKVYRATLTQTGTGAPVATVLENTFGAEIEWSRNAAGDYRATLAGAFPISKTVVLHNVPTTGIGICCQASRIGDSTIQVLLSALNVDFGEEGISWTGLDDAMLHSLYIEILVYP